MAATVTRRMRLASSVIRDNCAFHSGVSPQLPLPQSILDHLILACRCAYRSGATLRVGEVQNTRETVDQRNLRPPRRVHGRLRSQSLILEFKADAAAIDATP